MPESSAHLSLKVDGLGALASLVRALVLAQHNDLNNVVELVHGVEVGVEWRRLDQAAVRHLVPERREYPRQCMRDSRVRTR